MAKKRLTFKVGIGREVKLFNEQLHLGEQVFRLTLHGASRGVSDLSRWAFGDPRSETTGSVTPPRSSTPLDSPRTTTNE
jgi:hypothetical protein